MVGFIFLNDLTRLIVSNSSQATIFFNIEDLNTVALFKVLILVNFYIAIVKIFDRIIVCIKANTSFTHFLIISVSLYVLLFLISLLGEYTVHPFNLLIFLITGVILYYGHRNNFNELSYSSFIWIVLSISLYIVYFLYSYNVKKEAINRELLIENLSFQLTKEADPIAEMYLSEMEGKIKDDEKLIKMLLQSNDNEQEITSYLEKTYFYGYWKRYDIEVVVCWSNADLFIESENITTNCYSYFDELIQNQGSKANECEHFYFLDNDNGQVSYFGKIPFMQGNPDLETTLYCEINSTPTFSGLGYPELLKDQEEHANLTLFKNYSFAKYIDNKLVKQIGNYRYPIKFNSEVIKINEKKLYEDEDILHLLYKPNEKTTLILSRPSIKLIFLLMSFSSFALLFFFISWMLRFITRSYKTNSIFTHSIQERIQIALVGLMIVILLIMGVSSVFYSIHQFKEKNNQMLSQRIKSVLQEMEQKIVNEEKLDESMQDYLQYLMQKFSNVFFSDINLYDLDGKLLATSRPELYQQNLTGRMMNTQAYNELYYKQKTEYIHDEYIGKLHFTSAYVPIYNYNHEILAFLNLPYFVGNNELKSEVSSLIVAVINAYLLFILFGIGVAVIVSRRITRPLILIQDRLAQIRIDKQNKKIGYKGNDEIGNLVKEYNRMVDEISDSAEELAKSQREMAWREMAKQIAHEIKNPLTPMKLSVQYLTKAWDTQREDFDSFLKRVSKTLIEQIDQLHSIANEFSNFAKMPVPERTKIDITSKVTNTASLFEKSEPNIHFALNISSEKHFIYADNDQMLSVLNNIIKNAVQSIPSNRKGQISINLKKDNEDVLISISDNGRGMNEEVKSKIFMPNFTTKSSGMGLGLAIVKNIVNNSSGKIWFETNENIGTTFYIKFPLFKDA